jgi:hypothetical protein
VALFPQEDRLADPETEVLVLGQPWSCLGGSGEDALDLLVDPVRVLQLEQPAHPVVPGGEVGPGGLPSARHFDRLDELGDGEEIDLLALVRVAAREVERARVSTRNAERVR